MAIRKFIFPEQESIQYYLFAIHSVLIDYRLAFFLNKNLNIELKRASKDLDISGQDGFYSIFEFEDLDNLLNWNLISNCSHTNSKNENRWCYPHKNAEEFRGWPIKTCRWRRSAALGRFPRDSSAFLHA